MSEVIPITDGFGAELGFHYPMPAKPGAHCVYARAAELVVEWYDFGPQAPYDSANLLIFERLAQQRLAEAMGLGNCPSPHELAYEVAHRFDSYFEVRRFAEEHDAPFTTETDFQP